MDPSRLSQKPLKLGMSAVRHWKERKKYIMDLISYLAKKARQGRGVALKVPLWLGIEGILYTFYRLEVSNSQQSKDLATWDFDPQSLAF